MDVRQLDAAGIKKWGAAKTVQREAMKFWLVGLVSSALAGVYSLQKLRQRSRAVDKKEGEGAVESKKVAR
jgi:peroxin-11B